MSSSDSNETTCAKYLSFNQTVTSCSSERLARSDQGRDTSFIAPQRRKKRFGFPVSLIAALFLTVLTGCGGGGNNRQIVPENEPEKEPVTEKVGQLIFQNPLSKPVAGVRYRTDKSAKQGRTKPDGQFDFDSSDTEISFEITGQTYRVKPADLINVALLHDEDAERANLGRILLHLDSDDNPETGIDLDHPLADSASIDPAEPEKTVVQKLYQLTGRHPALLFKPSLGVNTEAPQAEADTAGQAMPFVDIFRTARPFAELSGKVKLDQHGWPTEVDPELGYAKTKLLQGTLAGAIPDGTYTLTYEGSGTIQLGGAVANIRALVDGQGLTFDLKLDPQNVARNEINLNLLDIAPGEGNYIRNIRIVMPGGLCVHANGEANRLVHVHSQQECPATTAYQSFADLTQKEERNSLNAVIFNPDYLAFLHNFKVIRTMNLMEASHGTSSCAITQDEVTEIDQECVLRPTRWDERATLSDVVWGGSGRTAHEKRNGVPVEVMVRLANILKRDIWVNLPHAAEDDYIRQYAEYVAANLDPDLKVYIEYANETWNPGFLGHFYVENKGVEAGLDTVPAEFESYRDPEYFARLRFYTRRALEIFAIWQAAHNDSNERLVRVLGTNQGDRVLSEQMLKYESAASKVDAVAMAPYFFGCTQAKGLCVNADKVLADAKTVDDIFDIIDQDKSVDPSALSATINKMASQADIASAYNVQLLAYEGGQHLTTSILGTLELSEQEKERFRALFREANRDPRMKLRYSQLLNGWRDLDSQGTTLFTLYTLPQAYYQFGNWGLKEHLNQHRIEAPKYDAVISFQEQMHECWWDRCATK